MAMQLDVLKGLENKRRMMTAAFRTVPASQRGITMIEILVTLVIVSVGLLGAAAMVLNGLESNRNAYLRTQASVLAYDIADRIRANSDQVGSYIGFEFDALSDDAPDLPGCYGSDAGCDGGNTAAADLAQWAGALEGVDGGVILLPSAQGSITQPGGDEILVRINWVESQWNDGDEAFEDQNSTFELRFNL